MEFVVGSPLCFNRNFSELCGFSLSSKLKHFKIAIRLGVYNKIIIYLFIY